MTVLFPSALMAETTLDGNNENGGDPNQVYYDFFANHCRIQAPQAKDDYVSVLVDMPAAGSEGVTEEMIANKRFNIQVLPESTTAAPIMTNCLIDETDSGMQFVFTSGKLPSLSENQALTVRYQVLDDNGDILAESDTECTVGAAAANKAFAKRALKLTVTPKTKTYTYNGKYNKPALTVKATYNGATVTSETLSYTTAYNNSKSVGTATVKITMTGDYTGSASAKYTINPRGTTLKSVSAFKKGFTVKWAKQGTKMTASKYIDAYQIQYSTSSKFASGNKTVTVKGYKNLSKKIKKLKAKKVYYVRVRTYLSVNGTKYYSAWSAAKKVKTK